jgi:hypothetical protein
MRARATLSGLLGERHEVEHLGGALPGFGRRDVEVAGVGAEVLEDAEVGVEVVVLGHDAETLLDGAGLAFGVHAEDTQRAGGDGRDAADHTDGAGLAGAVGAEQAKALALHDFEVDSVHGG